MSLLQSGRDLIGETFGDFRIIRLIGRGGMGEVYQAEQLSLGRSVALKVLRPELSADKVYLQRFRDEATRVAPLHHPNIVGVIGIGEDRGTHFIALEYVPGQTLRDYIKRKGALDIPLAVAILRRVTAALERAHEAGIIHRDIKPENVLLTRRDVKVADFGLARQITSGDVHLTQSGVTMGTPLYMSPEQIECKPLGPPTDLYSLGVMAYHMLAGEPPFEGDNPFMVAMKHLKNQAMPLSQVRPDIPRELEEVIDRLMAKRVEKRYQAARDVQRDLSKLARGLEQADGSLPLDGPTGASIPLPAGSATFTRSLSRGVDTVTQRFRRTSPRVKLALAGAIVLLVGVIAGAARRERALPDLPLTPSSRLERLVEGIERTRTQRLRPSAAEQLTVARQAAEGADRERALWEVLVFHPGHPREVIQAGTELFHTALDRRDLDLAEMVALSLTQREVLGLVGTGHLFDAIVRTARDPGPTGMAKARTAYERFAAVFNEPEGRPGGIFSGGTALSPIRGALGGREADHSWLVARAWLGWRRCHDPGTPDEAGKLAIQKIESALRVVLTNLDFPDRRQRGPRGPGGGAAPGGNGGGRAELGQRIRGDARS